MVSDKVVGGVIGFGLGFAACYLLIKSGTITLSMDKTVTQKKYGAMDLKDKSEHNPLAGFSFLENIPSADRLGEFKPIPINVELGTESSALAPVAEHGTRYHNKEKIKVVRGPNNRILGYETDRDAKISDV